MADQKYDKFLPIGSIVKTNNHNKPIMIIKINGSKEPNYLGVEHPLGFDSMEKLIQFNIENIESVYFIGRMNKEIETNLLKSNINLMMERKK